METEPTVVEKSKTYIIDNIMRWILFGVLLIVLPPLCNVWFKIIVGLNVTFVSYVPDMLLTVLSVCCNLINTCTDGTKKISHSLRWILGLSAGIIATVCWGLFFCIRFNLMLPIKYADKIFYISSAIIFTCAIIGIIIEWYTSVNIS